MKMQTDGNVQMSFLRKTQKTKPNLLVLHNGHAFRHIFYSKIGYTLMLQITNM